MNLEAPGAAKSGRDSTTKLPSACCCSVCVSTISRTSTPVRLCFVDLHGMQTGSCCVGGGSHALTAFHDCKAEHQGLLTLTYNLFDEARRLERG